MIQPALTRGGYAYRTQVDVGVRPGGRRHRVDAAANKDGIEIIISMKWQQVGGTAEQKVPFEVMCLADCVRNLRAARAYLVLGGDGWTLRDYFTSGALAEHLIHAGLVRVVTLEAFVRLANRGEL
ncbi:MAG: hypothetical protein IT182_03790 [Acidobacteria bacterium]|nr:hypothetical protein [Acidobacteriota bacterium]